MNKFSFAPFRDIAPYSENSKAVKRLNQRRKTIIDPFQEELVGARILDLSCHDGRWSYAMASRGAKQVVGIEGRQDVIDRFFAFPETEFMAEASGFELYWVDKELVFGKNREGLHDYFRDHRKVRSTCYLIPKQLIH